MGPSAIQSSLLLLLLGASTLTLVPALHCSKGISMSIEEARGNAFNWTTERVETCDNGTFCQESTLLIKAGAKTAVLATKGCISEGIPEVTFVQHSPPPGLTTVSYSSYCEESLCNNRGDLPELWKTREIPDTWEASSGSATLHCPTCVALGTCPSAPSLPCPNGTTQCYHGRLQVIGGGISSPLEVKGCSSVAGCRLMSGVFTVGPMWVKEMCPYQSPIQPQKIESGVPQLPVSVWRLELLLLLFLLQLLPGSREGASGPGHGTPLLTEPCDCWSSTSEKQVQS